ncbi:hypothetical protein COT62_01195 [Candidatus Roizmanbacteria bacterium CG09_land_8_20_14_0_10_41_9]|uniref:Mannosyl-glycoprotein endo-beta-N-acetylglucosamidase-like domain-containing protein n=1 Tax=Candidatus Roizmanbacteria bacterium CG09_land_8_20_14_0_10_41_9 TaxID=1974850 RepID=A0A2H0WTC1_9BACT|nr:MAG: hypothetical protein COT62_01195 [Candidatus Roizmanbacteria bacterium CG09_land_8_20_14_0_10_41_9]
MLKKTVVYSLMFILLLGCNLIAVRLMRKNFGKEQQIKNILTEIENAKNSSSQFDFSAGPAVMGVFTAETEVTDGRVANLKQFFRKYNSVLYDYAEKIVQVSDENQFDYRLLPAIAMQESNLCRVIPDDSHNCWGWGIYGNTVTRFESYDEAIDAVARGIKKHYIDKGLVTSSSIMEKYTPSSNGSWAHGVNTFLQMLE